MSNVGQMMKKLQDMQAKMAEMHQTLAETEITGSSGGGMISVVMTGKGDMRRLTIDPSLMNGSEKEVLEDLIVAAVNDARAKVESEAQAQMSKLTGGLPLPPGLKLPF